MACNNTYQFPLFTCVFDNETETRRYDFLLQDCLDPVFNTCESFMQFCDADTPYFNPVCESINNHLFFQLSFSDQQNQWPQWIGSTFYPGMPLYQWRLDPLQIQPWFIAGDLYDTCCNYIGPIDAYIVHSNVMGIEGEYRQNIEIDTTDLPEYFQFRFYTSDDRETFSPPYQKTCCEKLVKYRGIYNEGFNCENHYTGLPSIHIDTNIFGPTIPVWLGDNLSFINEITCIGTAYIESYNIEKTLNRNRTLKGTSFEILENWIERCPEYVASTIRNILSAKTIEVYNPDLNSSFNFNGAIDKNDSVSNMWSIQFKLNRWVCDLLAHCSPYEPDPNSSIMKGGT
jgi:hypothetical protein